MELLARYCEAAAARGISEVAITEHCHRFERIQREVIPHWERPGPAKLQEAAEHVLRVEGGGDLDAYVEALGKAQAAGLPILIGLEVDQLPGAGAVMDAVLAEYPFDVLLGSVHWLGSWLFDDYHTPVFADEWAARELSSVWSDYVDAVVEMARSGSIDVLAHLDLVKVAGKRPQDVGEHERRLAAALADHDVAVELSSAGLRKPAGETYPSASLLDLLIEAGTPLTTASDAHQVDQIGFGFDRLEAALEAGGVGELTSFRRRKRVRRPVR
jgi:histidinol-phosphatase (PHP family)